MDVLSAFRVGPPKGRNPTKRLSIVEISDKRTRQSLVIEHDGAIDAFNFDVPEAGWREGEAHPDGVVVGDVDGEVIVCFVELTGRLTDDPGSKETPAEHKLRQIEGVARHFHPDG